MKNITQFELFEAAKHHEMTTSADDFEHDGDTDNEVASWRKLGFTVKMTGRRQGEDDGEDDGPEYFKVSASVDDAFITNACAKLERAIKSAGGDFSEILHPTELEQFCKDANPSAAAKFADSFKKLNDLYK